jgi:hypothetical protein
LEKKLTCKKLNDANLVGKKLIVAKVGGAKDGRKKVSGEKNLMGIKVGGEKRWWGKNLKEKKLVGKKVVK